MTALDQLADELEPRQAAVSAALHMPMNTFALERFGPTQARIVMDALWPNAMPHAVGRGDWWRSDLGRLVAGVLAQQLATSGDETITHGAAAEIMGVQRGGIGNYIGKGYITKGARGEGVSLASVLARVAR